MTTNQKITVYIEKGSVYYDSHNSEYRAFVHDNKVFLEAGKTYYAYELDLPEEEVARIEEQGEAERVDDVTLT
jgi:hypothetical protein